MFEVKFSFVPPGGGEQDYMAVTKLPEIPRVGDYIDFHRDGESGVAAFLVRRTWWHFDTNDDGSTLKSVWVEAEFVDTPFSSESHKRCIEMYAARGKVAKEVEATAY